MKIYEIMTSIAKMYKCNEGYIRELVIELLYTRRNGRAGTRDVMFKML